MWKKQPFEIWKSSGYPREMIKYHKYIISISYTVECIIRKQSPRYSNRQFGVSTFEPFQLELPFPPAAAFQYRSDGPALPEAKMYFLLAKTHGMTWVKQCFIFSMGNPLLGELNTRLIDTTYIYICICICICKCIYIYGTPPKNLPSYDFDWYLQYFLYILKRYL